MNKFSSHQKMQIRIYIVQREDRQDDAGGRRIALQRGLVGTW